MTQVQTIPAVDSAAPGPLHFESRALEVGPSVLQVIRDAEVQSTREWRSRLRLFLVTLDVALVTGALYLALLTRFGRPDAAVSGLPYVLVAGLIGAVWLACLVAYGAYDMRVLGVGTEEYRRVLAATFTAFAVVAVACYAAHVSVARGFVALALPAGAVSLLVGRHLVRRALRRQRDAGRWMNRLLVVGDPSSTGHLTERFAAERHSGYAVVGSVSETTLTSPHGNGGRLGEAVASTARALRADAVAVAPSPVITPAEMREIAWALEGSGADLLVAPSLTEVATQRVQVLPSAGLPMLHLEEPQFTGTQRVVKNLLDRGAALLLLVLLSPVLAAIGLAVWLTDRGPVLFRQTRVGVGGRDFRVYKFRTMGVDAESLLARLLASNDAEGPLFKLRDDPRVTPVGRWLRRTSLDELPQLLNVLRGEMSLVGPRPPLPAEVAQYERKVRRRLLVKPGMTGLWQVSGRSDLSWEDAVRLDLYYVENWSPLLDLTILLRTIAVVVRGSGAY